MHELQDWQLLLPAIPATPYNPSYSATPYNPSYSRHSL